MGGCGESVTAPLCHFLLLTLLPAPMWILPQAAVLRDKPTPAWTPLVWEPFLSGGPASSWALQGLQFSSGNTHLLWCEVLHGRPWGTCSTMASPGTARGSLPRRPQPLLSSSCSHPGTRRAGAHAGFPAPHCLGRGLPFLK